MFFLCSGASALLFTVPVAKIQICTNVLPLIPFFFRSGTPAVSDTSRDKKCIPKTCLNILWM